MALILPCGRPSIHTMPLFCSLGKIVTEAASALVADSYFPITGKISEVFNSVGGVTGFTSYFEMIASTVGFFLGSHVCVCCACTDMVSKDNTVTPTITMVFFIISILND